MDAVRALVSTVGSEVALFCVVHDHLHLVLVAPDRRVVGRRCQALSLALRGVLMRATGGATVQPAWVRPVEDVGHLRALIRYVLNQAERHGLGVHAALWSGSILPDLVGARWLPNLAPCLWRLMPTLDVSELLAAVGLTGRLDPLPLPELWTVGAAGLVAAAERAAGVSAAGAEARRGASRVRARRAAAKLGRLAGIPTCQMAAALGLSEGGTRKAAAREVPTELLAATRLRVALDRLARPASGGVGVERGI